MVQQRERDESSAVCTACGMDIGVDPSHSWEDESGVRLCWECALRRGGVFDARKDTWTTAPNVGDLPDERRAHP